MDRRVWCAGLFAVMLLSGWHVRTGAQATDLDDFMRQVLAKRDDNWKKLQQYVLDERETTDFRGPGRVQVWGDRKEYTWYIRDGFFVRSPVRFNGVTIGEADRRKYEKEFLEREQRRERRRRENSGASDANPAPAEPDMQAFLRQTREPEFISAAYFLRFRFEEGKYALVGREHFDAGDVLKIEYYPTNLFRGTDRRRGSRKEDDVQYDAEFRRLMNKTALVTLWVEPTAHQIVKYTFDNIAMDFLPAQWLLHMDELHASMTMGQPFRGQPEGRESADSKESNIWLPSKLEFAAALSVAVGQFDARYTLEYHNYRRADVTSKITIPKD